jgi:hypothetical protein
MFIGRRVGINQSNLIIRLIKTGCLALMLLLTSTLSLPALANFASNYVKFKNVKINKAQKRKINKNFDDFLYENQGILFTKISDKFKDDQFCHFSFKTDADHNVISDSIKVVKSNENYRYNLKVFQFLKNSRIKVNQDDDDEPMIIKFVYRAY